MTSLTLLRSPSMISPYLRLLDLRSRLVLIVLAVVQGLSALLDVIAIYALAIATAIATELTVGQSTGSWTLPLMPDNFLSFSNRPEQVLGVVAVLAFVLLVARSAFSFLITRFSLRFLARRQAEVSEALAEAYFAQDFTKIVANKPAKVAYTLTWGVSAGVVGVIGQAMTIMSELLILVVLFTGLAFADPLLALGTLAYFAAIATAFHYVLAPWANRMGRQVAEQEVGGQQQVLDLLKTNREMRLSGRLMQAVGDFAESRRQSSEAEASLTLATVMPRYVFEIGLVIGLALVAVAQLSRGSLVEAVGALVLFLATTSRIIPSLMRLQGAILKIRGSIPQSSSMVRLADELGVGSVPESTTEYDEPIQHPIARSMDQRMAVHIRVRDLHAAFSESINGAGLRGLNLEVQPGALVGIVGRSGAGKTTLIELVLGFRSGFAGSVTLDGLDPREYSQGNPGFLAYLPQDVALVAGDLRTNVALGVKRTEVNDALVWECLDQVGLAELLMTERQGLDTQIGDAGVMLSGGQRQRIGLARALYQRPSLLVIDEGTSALDIQTESQVMEVVESLRGGMTVIVVAHRYSTLEHCDYVVALDAGRIVAEGSITELQERLGWMQESKA